MTEEILHALSQTNKPGEIENEEIKLKPQMDTEKLPSSYEIRKALRVLQRRVYHHFKFWTTLQIQTFYQRFFNSTKKTH